MRIRLLQNLGLHDIHTMNRDHGANIPLVEDGKSFAVIGAELDLPDGAVAYLRKKFQPAGDLPCGMFEEVRGVAKPVEVRGVKSSEGK